MSTDELESTYEVSRTTTFAWSSSEQAAEAEPHLQRSAQLIGQRLYWLCPDRAPVVEVVRVEDAPQLRVSMRLPRGDRDAVVRRFGYYLDRAMTVKIPMGPGHRRRLKPPWGTVVVNG